MPKVLIKNWPGMSLVCVLSAMSALAGAAPLPPVPESVPRAQLPLGSGSLFRKRCPDVQAADPGASATIVFWLQRNGTPTHVSVAASSGSDALDAAAAACVSKLQFAPATTLGDGQSIDSWQQYTLAWASQAGTGETRGAPPRGPAPALPPRVPADARPEDIGAPGSAVTVRVCVDATGKLQQEPTVVRSSGNASADQAAVKIAAAGAPYYRPEHTTSGTASGCAQLAIKFDAR